MQTATQAKPQPEPVDPKQLEQFLHKFVGDMGAAMSAALILVGDELGLYRTMAEADGPVTPDRLAELTSTDSRYIREWLAAQAAAGYVMCDADTNTFWLSPEQALTLGQENSPADIVGGFQVVASMFKDVHKITEAFRGGIGVGWHEHHPLLFQGTERFFRSSYASNLLESWLPALDGVVEKLKNGCKIADVGCGYGASTILMAEAFPKSRFMACDYHPASIEKARQKAWKAGLSEHIDFKVTTAKEYPGNDFDLVCMFDCLHDMGDPVGAAKHVLQSLKPDGTWMIVEPFAHDEMKGNLNPIGRVFYSASTMICTPASKAQEVGLALGAQAGEKRIREVVMEGGFTRFRRAAETPFNIVYEARP
ncbi:MAG TPA: class I SAM-dependent methyltransferase [Terriglobales bacterium]|nr:class I SAM-dependent methyltransferase [Terriglobales bacterium]